MPTTQKFTVEVPTELLQQARAATGGGVTEAVREGLQAVSRQAQHALLNLRGKDTAPAWRIH